MTPQDQLHPHNPEKGIFGDCWRASIASLMDLPTEVVPHFLHDGCNGQVAVERLNKWLLDFDLCYIEFKAWDMEKEFSHIFPLYHTISDVSPRFPGAFHAVVGKNGVVVHDPHPSKLGLPEVTEERTFGLLIKRNVR